MSAFTQLRDLVGSKVDFNEVDRLADLARLELGLSDDLVIHRSFHNNIFTDCAIQKKKPMTISAEDFTGDSGLIMMSEFTPIENHPRYAGELINSEKGKELIEYVKSGTVQYKRPYGIMWERVEFGTIDNR